MSWWAGIEWWARFLRDIGIILGFPTVILVGIHLYKSHIKALKAEINTLERNMDFLRETQYPRAMDLLKGQKECFEMEREHIVEKIKSVVRDPGAQENLIDVVRGSFRTVENKAEMTTLAVSGWVDLIEIMEGKHITFEGEGR